MLRWSESNCINCSQDPREIKTIRLNRIKATMDHLASLPTLSERLKQSIFGQLHKELRSWSNSAFRRSYVGKGHGGQKRAFKVKFMGEGVNDYGGPYRAIFESIVDELQADSAMPGRKISERCLLPILIPCPNRSSAVGSNQDKYVLSPAAASPLVQELTQLFGKLVGLAVRHNLTLGLACSSLLWRPLAKLPVNHLHLETVDSIVCNQLREMRKLGEELENLRAANGVDEHGNALTDAYRPEEWKEYVFAVHLSDGTRLPLVPRGEDIPVNLGNWRQYVSMIERARIRESTTLMKVFKDGLSTNLPTELFPLFTSLELEQLVAGSSDVDVDMLRHCTEYEDPLHAEAPLVKMFWEVLEEMSNDERTMFLRFVWARSRMPASLSDLTMNFKLQLSAQADDMKKNPDNYLPSAQTCFFSLSLPDYTSKEVLRQKLLYAIENSPNMDADVRLHSAEGWADA